jgi:hypothetical protein
MNKPKLAIIVPDLNGEHSNRYLRSEACIFADIKRLYPDAYIIPALNGTQGDFSKTEAISRFGFHPLISSPGLACTLNKAYSKTGSVDVVVRLDVDEHPVYCIGELAERARQIEGVVVGDLEHREELMPRDSFEYFSNTEITPKLFSSATGGRLHISGAHGFCAISKNVLPALRSQAYRIWRKAAQRSKKTELSWGFDAMIYLSAIGLGVPIEVKKIMATEFRSRDRKKIIEQRFADEMAINAAKEIFGW